MWGSRNLRVGRRPTPKNCGLMPCRAVERVSVPKLPAASLKSWTTNWRMGRCRPRPASRRIPSKAVTGSSSLNQSARDSQEFRAFWHRWAAPRYSIGRERAIWTIKNEATASRSEDKLSWALRKDSDSCRALPDTVLDFVGVVRTSIRLHRHPWCKISREDQPQT